MGVIKRSFQTAIGISREIGDVAGIQPRTVAQGDAVMLLGRNAPDIPKRISNYLHRKICIIRNVAPNEDAIFLTPLPIQRAPLLPLELWLQPAVVRRLQLSLER